MGDLDRRVQVDALPCGAQAEAELDVLHARAGVRLVEPVGLLEHGTADGAASRPERPGVAATGVVHVMMKQVLELRDEPWVSGAIVVGADDRGGARMAAQVRIDLGECIRMYTD